MGRLEMPLPDMGGGMERLEVAARKIRASILANVPVRFRDSISVRPFGESGRTGIAIEYDDLAEPFVYAALEYPRDGEDERDGPECR